MNATEPERRPVENRISEDDLSEWHRARSPADVRGGAEIQCKACQTCGNDIKWSGRGIESISWGNLSAVESLSRTARSRFPGSPPHGLLIESFLPARVFIRTVHGSVKAPLTWLRGLPTPFVHAISAPSGTEHLIELVDGDWGKIEELVLMIVLLPPKASSATAAPC